MTVKTQPFNLFIYSFIHFIYVPYFLQGVQGGVHDYPFLNTILTIFLIVKDQFVLQQCTPSVTMFSKIIFIAFHLDKFMLPPFPISPN